MKNKAQTYEVHVVDGGETQFKTQPTSNKQANQNLADFLRIKLGADTYVVEHKTVVTSEENVIYESDAIVE
jgi:hypothetical protein